MSQSYVTDQRQINSVLEGTALCSADPGILETGGGGSLLPSLLLLSPFPSPSSSLRSRPLKLAIYRESGDRCKLPSGVRGRATVENEFGEYSECHVLLLRRDKVAMMSP